MNSRKQLTAVSLGGSTVDFANPLPVAEHHGAALLGTLGLTLRDAVSALTIVPEALRLIVGPVVAVRLNVLILDLANGFHGAAGRQRR